MILSRRGRLTLRCSILAVAFALAGLSAGCESTSSADAKSPAELRSRTGNVSDGQYRRRGGPQSRDGARNARIPVAAMVSSAQYWHENLRDDSQIYFLDPFDQRLPSRFRQRLESYFTPFDAELEDTAQTFTFEKTEMPEPGWVFTTYRVGDRYHAIEYTAVFSYAGDQFLLRDHFKVAEGTIERAMVDFKWPSYRALLDEKEAARATEAQE